MALKNCSACQKMVYPMEALKCLDKNWHKACFKCQVCGMTLNMKNYKGYNKLPYCNAHYPTTKFTAVADTPENMRIKKNTAVQSNIKYHAEFEAAKGKHTSVADDPETLRIRKNTNQISNVAYHGEISRREQMENARPTEIETSSSDTHVEPAPRAQPRGAPAKVAEFDPAESISPYSSKTQSTTVYDSASANTQRQDGVPEEVPPSEPPVQAQPAPVFTPPQPAPPVFAPPEPEPEPPAAEPEAAPPVEIPPPVEAPPPVESPPTAADTRGKVAVALYDYTAADDDEISFVEGDKIIQCDPIDEGWMNGTVERTGETGMLPSNYVEPQGW